MLNKAIIIAVQAHQGQADKAGQPYIFHPLRVMLSCKNETERICAVLHDVIEDTEITFEDLRNNGFPEEIICAIAALTKCIDEGYEEFIQRVIKNNVACHVKLADLKDNMDLSRIKSPTDEDYIRLEKYKKAETIIRDALKKNELNKIN